MGDYVSNSKNSVNITGSVVDFGGNVIRITGGSSFTLTGLSSLQMNNASGNAYISVEDDFLLSKWSGVPRAGGILNITNSSTITSTGTWKGIGVWGGSGHVSPGIGNYHFSQRTIYPARAVLDHAHIFLSKQGIQNNDITAVPSAAGADQYYGSAGGIVQANYCTFSGNTWAFFGVEYQNWFIKGGLTTYSNYSSSNRVYTDDESFFRNSTFSMTSDPIPQGPFIFLSGTHGIHILGCTFQDNSNTSHPTSGAIFAEGDDFVVDNACNDPLYSAMPCSRATGTTISKLWVGVESDAASAIGKLLIQNITMGQVYRNGIRLADDYSGSVLKNSVVINKGSGVSGEGILFQTNGVGYRVEENTVSLYNGSDYHDTYGIVMNSTGESQNQVYKNTIDDMQYSIQANDINFNTSAPQTGLKIICNDLSPNPWAAALDMNVNTATTPASPASLICISTLQGVSSGTNVISAGNIFAFPKTYSFDNFDHLGSNTINYYHSGGSELPTNHTGNVNPILTRIDNSCPSNFATVSDRMLPIPPQKLVVFNGYRRILENQISLQTPGVAHANGIYPYDSLLSLYSMHIDSAIRNFAFTDSFYQYKGDSIFIKYYIDTVASGGGSQIYDTTMQFIDSAITSNDDSIAQILDSTKYIWEYKLERAKMYAFNGDYSSCISLLNSIPSNYTLSTASALDLNNLITLFSIEDSLYKHKQQWDSLSSGDTTTVWQIATDSIGYARYKARSILSKYDGIYFEAEVAKVDTTLGYKHAQDLFNKVTAASVQLSPNPVDNVLNIALNGYTGNVKGVVYDLKGSKVAEIPLNGNGTTSFSTAELPEGVYMLKVLNNRQVISMQKFVKK